MNSFYITVRTMLLLLLFSWSVRAQTTTVNWTNVHQQMDGWGAEDWLSAYSLTSAQANTFFSPTSGIGLEYIRTGNYACPVTGACTVATSNVPDLTTLQEAVALGAKVEVNVQPPADLQYNGNFANGTPGPDGNCIESTNWSAFATFTVNWINMLAANGVPVSVLSVANEPNLNQPDSLGGCVWTAAGLDSYIGGYLGPALASAGLTPAVMLPESSNFFDTDLVSTCLNDSTCAQFVSIAAGHGYGLGSVDGTNGGYCCHTAVAPPSSTSGKRIWMSEVNGGFTFNSTANLWNFDPSMADALVWAHNIHDYLTVSNVSGWEYWELADCCSLESGAPFNDGLTDANFDTSQRMYAIGNWSKFVRSGYYRIDATANPQSEVYVSAFQDTPSGTLVIVAINNGGSNVSQTFSITNGPNFTSVTPWITSASLSLAQQSAISVSANSFTSTLAASSVTTFVGSVKSTPPAPPTKLSATVVH